VRHRLLVAGAKDPSIFTEAAMTMIGEAAHGVPRLINVVADHCLLMGYSEQKPKVDIELVEKSVGYLRAEGGLTLTDADPSASGLDWLATGDLPHVSGRRQVGGPIFQALVQSEKQRVLRGGEGGAAPRSPVAAVRFEQRFPDLEAAPAAGNGGDRPGEPPPAARERSLVGRPVDDLQAVEQHLVSLVDPASFEAEQYRTLRSSVEDLRRARGSCVVAVSSAALGEGKTTTSINLAGALAQGRDHRVLLIDADLRRPSIAGQLGLGRNGEQGLVDAIQDPRLGLRDMVRICPAFHLAVLPAGRFTRQPYETLQSPRFGHLLTQARHAFDYVVVDTPPLLPVSDCRLIAEWVDGFLLVIAADSTPRKSVEDALGIIDAEQLIGFVFNRDHRAKAGYYYGYGHP
jgi:capsular exopolysaccharide synthesis family protein